MIGLLLLPALSQSVSPSNSLEQSSQLAEKNKPLFLETLSLCSRLFGTKTKLSWKSEKYFVSTLCLSLFFAHVTHFKTFCYIFFLCFSCFRNFRDSLICWCFAAVQCLALKKKKAQHKFSTQEIWLWKFPWKVNVEPGQVASVGAFISGWHILHSSITSSSINHILWFKKRHPLVYEQS